MTGIVVPVRFSDTPNTNIDYQCTYSMCCLVGLAIPYLDVTIELEEKYDIEIATVSEDYQAATNVKVV